MYISPCNIKPAKLFDHIDQNYLKHLINLLNHRPTETKFIAPILIQNGTIHFILFGLFFVDFKIFWINPKADQNKRLEVPQTKIILQIVFQIQEIPFDNFGDAHDFFKFYQKVIKMFSICKSMLVSFFLKLQLLKSRCICTM